MPALVSVTAGVVEPRYPSFKGIMAAKSKPVDQLTVADLGLDAGQVGAAGAGQEILSGRRRRRRARPARSSRTTARATRRSSPTSRTSRSSEPARPDEGDTAHMALNRIWVFAEASDGKVTPAHARAAGQGPVSWQAPSRPFYGDDGADAWPRRLGAHGAHQGLRHRPPRRRAAGRARRLGDRRAGRGRRRARPDHVRHHLRRPRRRRPPVGRARQAGHHQQRRHRGRRRRRRRHRARSSAARSWSRPGSPPAGRTSRCSGPSRSWPRSPAAGQPRWSASRCPTRVRPR